VSGASGSGGGPSGAAGLAGICIQPPKKVQSSYVLNFTG